MFDRMTEPRANIAMVINDKIYGGTFQYSTIQDYVDCSERTVRRTIDEMVEHGHLERMESESEKPGPNPRSFRETDSFQKWLRNNFDMIQRLVDESILG